MAHLRCFRRTLGGIVAIMVALSLGMGLTGCKDEASNGLIPVDANGRILTQDVISNGGANAISAMSSLMVHQTLDDLCDGSELIIEGTVTDVHPSILVEPVDGASPVFFTNVDVVVNKRYYGDVEEGEKVVIRLAGGMGSRIGSWIEDNPQLILDQTYLLYLHRTYHGMYYTTGADYFKVTGLFQGCWTTYEGGYRRGYGEESLTFEEAAAYFADYAKEHPLEMRVAERQRELDDLRQQNDELHRNGAISDSEMRHFKEQLEAAEASFARIMSPEEQLEYELSMIELYGGDEDEDE